MLETEIKKLTAALEANTAALTGGVGGTQLKPQAASQPAAPAPVATPPAPSAAPTAGPAVAPPVAAPAQPAPVAPAPIAPGTPQMTHQQAQAELTAIVQQLGDGTQVQAVMQQYGSARLNEIPVENLFSMVQACKALITA